MYNRLFSARVLLPFLRRGMSSPDFFFPFPSADVAFPGHPLFMISLFFLTSSIGVAGFLMEFCHSELRRLIFAKTSLVLSPFLHALRLFPQFHLSFGGRTPVREPCFFFWPSSLFCRERVFQMTQFPSSMSLAPNADSFCPFFPQSEMTFGLA